VQRPAAASVVSSQPNRIGGLHSQPSRAGRLATATLAAARTYIATGYPSKTRTPIPLSKSANFLAREYGAIGASAGEVLMRAESIAPEGHDTTCRRGDDPDPELYYYTLW
jgi:hypothetical protein